MLSNPDNRSESSGETTREEREFIRLALRQMACYRNETLILHFNETTMDMVIEAHRPLEIAG